MLVTLTREPQQILKISTQAGPAYFAQLKINDRTPVEHYGLVQYLLTWGNLPISVNSDFKKENLLIKSGNFCKLSLFFAGNLTIFRDN